MALHLHSLKYLDFIIQAKRIGLMVLSKVLTTLTAPSPALLAILAFFIL